MADKDEFFIAKHMPTGELKINTASKLARGVRGSMSSRALLTWEQCRKLGWRVVKVRLVEVKR